MKIIKEIEKYISPKGQPKRRFIFECICGKHFVSTLSNIKCGNTKSCGCLKSKYNIKVSKQEHYQRWKGIKGRCFNMNGKDWVDYGGRGITMYEPWIKNYLVFEDYINNNLGKKPDGYSLDRIDNDGNYEPSNLRWASPIMQSNNQRKKKKNI
jgi:hypothetical protein